MAITRNHPFYLKSIPSQIFIESAKLGNKLYHREVLGIF